MVFPLIFAAASVAVSAASAVASHQGQQQNAKAQAAHQGEVNRIQAQHRDDLAHWQNRVWEQDLDHAREVLAFAHDEFTRQERWVEEAQASVAKNRDASAFALMIRGVEESIASSFGEQNIARQGRAVRATYSAKDRGVEGNNVEQVLGDVFREEGEAATVTAMNRDALGRQMFREAMALDAQHDNQMSQIASGVRTYAPTTPIRAPSPVNPLQPQAPVAGPSGAALAVGLGNAVAGGFNTYSTFSGQNGQQIASSVGNWFNRQFTP